MRLKFLQFLNWQNNRAEHPDLVLATPPKRSAQVLATAKASEVKPVEVSPPAPAPVFDSRIFVWSAAEESSKKDSSQTIGDGKTTNPVDKDLKTDDKKSVVTPESKTLVSKKLSAKLRPHSSHAIVPDQNVPATMAIEPLNSSPSQNLDSLVKVVAPEDNPEHDVPPAKEESKTESGDTLWDIHAGSHRMSGINLITCLIVLQNYWSAVHYFVAFYDASLSRVNKQYLYLSLVNM